MNKTDELMAGGGWPIAMVAMEKRKSEREREREGERDRERKMKGAT